MRVRPVLAAVAAVGLASLGWAGAAAGAAPAAGRHASRVCAQAVTGASCQALRLDPATAPACHIVLVEATTNSSPTSVPR